MFVLLVDYGGCVQVFEEAFLECVQGQRPDLQRKLANSNTYRPGPVSRVMFLYVCVK